MEKITIYDHKFSKVLELTLFGRAMFSEQFAFVHNTVRLTVVTTFTWKEGIPCGPDG